MSILLALLQVVVLVTAIILVFMAVMQWLSGRLVK